MTMRRAALLIALLLLSAMTARAADPGPLLGPFIPGTPITREAVLETLNYYRGVHGLPPYREDARLDAAAEDRFRDMEDLDYYGHVAPDGRSPFTWILSRGYLYAAAGENLARGFETTQLLVQSWMESPGHRRNILSGDYRDVGIAIIDGAPSGRAIGRSVVLLFASEKKL